jgi:hypothetical protein
MRVVASVEDSMTHFSMSHSTRRSLLIAAAAIAALAVGWMAPVAWEKQERPPGQSPLDLTPGAVRG